MLSGSRGHEAGARTRIGRRQGRRSVWSFEGLHALTPSGRVIGRPSISLGRAVKRGQSAMDTEGQPTTHFDTPIMHDADPSRTRRRCAPIRGTDPPRASRIFNEMMTLRPVTDPRLEALAPYRRTMSATVACGMRSTLGSGKSSAFQQGYLGAPDAKQSVPTLPLITLHTDLS